MRTAADVFGVSRATVYWWLRRVTPHDLTTLEDRSRRPKWTRKHPWSASEEQAALPLRQAHPRFGKDETPAPAAGIMLSASMIGRMLRSLTRRRLLIEPLTMRVRHPKPARPYATRMPGDKRQPT